MVMMVVMAVLVAVTMTNDNYGGVVGVKGNGDGMRMIKLVEYA